MTLAPTSKVGVEKKVVMKSSFYIAEDRRQRKSSLLRWMKGAKEALTGGFARKSSIREVSEAHRFWPSKNLQLNKPLMNIILPRKWMPFLCINNEFSNKK
jgi:hypothetical protein